MKTLLIIIGIVAALDLLIVGGCLKASSQSEKRDLED